MSNNFSVVACIMAHDDDKYIKLVLDDLSKYTESIFVNLNDPTDEVKKIVTSHPKVVKIIHTSNNGERWNQGLQRDNTIRMLDQVRPDIILFPDSDETYPDNLLEQLEEFWNDEDTVTFWFRLLYMWGDEDHFRNDKLWKKIHHVRILKWSESITYLPKYAGYACPTNHINLARKTRFNSNMPTKHWGYMHEEDRSRKYLRANCNYCNDDYREKIDKDKLIVDVPDELKGY